MLQVITTQSDPTNILTTRCEGITNDEIKALTQEFLYEFLNLCDTEGGIGLAAPQVGIKKRFFTIRTSSLNTICFNPSFKTVGNKRYQNSIEGCLSVPGKSKVVLRHRTIIATWRDIDLLTLSITLTGLDAFVFQHELDHLNGIHL